MNQEQIKELASQARKYADDNEEHWKSGSGRDWDSLFEQKFAELIVRECMTVARKADGLDAEYEAWYLIKQHFGVEE